MRDLYENLSEEDKNKLADLTDLYELAAHAVQSGIMHKLELDTKYGTPKDLRVGIDLGKAEMAGLVTLLLRKGVFTLVEYHEAIVEAVEQDKERYEADLSNRMGRPVKLA